ncbi:MAG: LysR family transcriptional regulator [Microcystis sp. M015S1]|jgi:LysR family transcriptional regulator for metE and metH|uniref:LysR family transcriptional regulator n=2 Tax=unclassified Microcystis TaxID=2643300 RepID=UPI00258B9E6B|nr:LysR family transcriptional regulator [Microcystis sp. M017S1]MCA2919181.1 LysR family transcriptional regulator [Microcystis sp. M017S1]MCA2936198.1 LysR family transcriptional regulator [Microcystis sp. M015S1]MCA3160675.1 LysR family transcriptional regulator [Burkholderiales bacterium]MCA3173510.1 LysR family transcriptional regulator [Burkholderiales bacterium]
MSIQSLLELRHLKTLLALREAGSLSRAAHLLNLTQSALSHQMKVLEDQYSTDLFERKSVPVQFSSTGLRLLELADQVVSAVDAAERDLNKLVQGAAGQLRIAVECHTCFDWLMPAMDAFRQRWPEVELDIVSGFHADPVDLLYKRQADIAIVSEAENDNGIKTYPLFTFDIVAILSNSHSLCKRKYLTAKDFGEQTLITYPVPDEMIDIIQRVLRPKGIHVQRRTTELTIAILQLVASGRGIAALPMWAVQSYLDKGYVTARSIGVRGLNGSLYVATLNKKNPAAYFFDFIRVIREVSFINLRGIRLLD